MTKLIYSNNKFIPTSIEEEKALAARIAKGDRDALDELVRRNLRNVANVARKYATPALTLSDLINEGTLGLTEAAKRFDATQGNRFITYAQAWIRKSILDAIRKNANMIRLPEELAYERIKLNRVKDNFRKTHGNEASDEELAKLAGMSPEEVRKVDALDLWQVSLDDCRQDEDESDPCRMYDMIACEDDTEARIDNDALHAVVMQILNQLPQNERDVLILSFGLDGKGERKTAEVAEELNMTPRRVTDLKTRAINRIRANANAMSTLQCAA